MSARPLLDWDGRDCSRFSGRTRPFPILYLSERKLTGFWECYGDQLLDQMADERSLPVNDLAARQWVTFDIDPALRAIDLTQTDTLRDIGADGASFVAHYAITQKWADALMRHPAAIDAIFYRSRLDSGERCLAVFGRPKLLRARRRFRPARAGALLGDIEIHLLLAREDIALV